jgi:hypothetical protein
MLQHTAARLESTRCSASSFLGTNMHGNRHGPRLIPFKGLNPKVNNNLFYRTSNSMSPRRGRKNNNSVPAGVVLSEENPRFFLLTAKIRQRIHDRDPFVPR